MKCAIELCFFYEILSQHDKVLSSAYILNPPNVSPVGLERSIMIYQQNVTEKPFDIKSVPTVDISHTESSKGNEFFPKSSNGPRTREG